LPQGSIFALLDAAFSGKRDQALTLYREQRAMKVEPQLIVSMLSWQLYIMLLAKTAGTRSADAVAKEAKLSPFVVRKSQAAVRRLTRGQIERFVSDLLALDIQLKRSSIDADEALQLYILKLAV
jgi:DNA polymerase-3 subunit delta